jgi:hypothetical protein
MPNFQSLFSYKVLAIGVLAIAAFARGNYIIGGVFF